MKHGEASKCQGKKPSTEYRSWLNMRQRCINKRNPRYKDYGGRGITVCARWSSFKNFLEDMGRKPGPEYSVERKNNDEGYFPENCYWGTPTEQSNNRRSSKILILQGRSMTVAQWARHLGTTDANIQNRLKYGWSEEEALSTPFIPGRNIRRSR